MNNLKFLLGFLNYKLFSGHKYGHGIHSPFVFDYITGVLNDKSAYKEYDEVEKIRKQLVADKRKILCSDCGAGSRRNKQNLVKIKNIAKYSAVNKKFGQLLFRMVKYFNPCTILELGTSLGISTMYMAGASGDAKIISIESDENTAEIARQNFYAAGLNNIDLVVNRFENVLPGIIERLKNGIFVFIDGNHKKSATLQYFNQLLVKSENNMVMVIDDIQWSEGMRQAWQEIKSKPEVKITLDLFFMGIVFFNQGVQKQNFTIRY